MLYDILKTNYRVVELGMPTEMIDGKQISTITHTLWGNDFKDWDVENIQSKNPKELANTLANIFINNLCSTPITNTVMEVNNHNTKCKNITLYVYINGFEHILSTLDDITYITYIVRCYHEEV